MSKAKKDTNQEIIKLTGISEVLNSLQLHVKAKKGQYNQFGRYKYRTAEDILLAVKEELRKEIYPQNVTILTNVELKEILDRLFVCVTASLRVGDEKVDSQGLAEHAKNKKGMDEAQLTGATITYARKYALQNLFGIDESEDDIDSNENKNVNSYSQLANIASGVKDEMDHLKNIKKTDDEERKQKAQGYFQDLKKKIEDAGDVAEIDGILEKEASAIGKLETGYKTIHNQLMICVKSMKELLDPANLESLERAIK